MIISQKKLLDRNFTSCSIRVCNFIRIILFIAKLLLLLLYYYYKTICYKTTLLNFY